MTRQIIALLILVALIAGIFRAIQQSTLNQQGSLPSETNSISTARVPSATQRTASNTTHTDASQSLATATAVIVTTSTTTSIAVAPQRTLRPTTNAQTGNRPTQFPNTGLIDELDVLQRPIVGLSVLAGIIAILAYVGGRRR